MKKPLCNWCWQESDLGVRFIPASPILEWMEEKINKIDNDLSRDASIKLSLEEENEINLYDSLLNETTKGYICSHCLVGEQMLWDKYYTFEEEDDDEEIDWDLEDDF